MMFIRAILAIEVDVGSRRAEQLSIDRPYVFRYLVGLVANTCYSSFVVESEACTGRHRKLSAELDIDRSFVQ